MGFTHTQSRKHFRKCQGRKQRYEVSVVPVATEMSLKRLPELVERVESIWKKSTCNVSVEIKHAHPYDHSLSIANNQGV